MQRCQFCGAQLADDARFCGNCGRSPVPANQPGISIAQGAPQSSEMARANPASPFPTPGAPQPSSQPSQFQAPLPQAPQFRPSPQQPQQAFPAQFPSPQPQQPQQSSQQFQQFSRPETPPPFQPSQPQHFQQPSQPGGPPPQFPQQGGKTSRGAIPPWLLVAIVAIIVIAIGGGAFALLHHTTSPSSQSNTSGASSNPATKFTPVSSCIANASHSANLTFSGAVSGNMVISSFMGCGPLTYQGQQGYVGNASGSIGNANYNFLFAALGYNGPGTYTFPKVATTLDQQGGSTPKNWVIDPTASNTITINSDGKSGTLSLHLIGLSDITAKVSVTGAWSS
ncbi:MAG TPA: zinc ribbon domain-containing protein [Ktedonobacteraceae bacterium]|jgi:hypothetical protein|nr:zinc ribbon domain-containing protein [Ktedonobacteraceae bacterium]